MSESFVITTHGLLTVSVVVVEDGHAGLRVSVELSLLPVVRLRHPQAARV